jgi:2,3-bisphosphoglycerate-dependent phosphoglycerate mutase
VIEGISEYDAHSDEYIPIEELRALKDDRWHATIEGRWGDVGGVDPREFQRQVVPAIDDLIAHHPGRTVAAFTHGGVVNVYLAHLLGIDRLLWFHPEYTSISRVHAARTGPKSVATVNETAHLVATR